MKKMDNILKMENVTIICYIKENDILGYERNIEWSNSNQTPTSHRSQFFEATLWCGGVWHSHTHWDKWEGFCLNFTFIFGQST